MTCGYIFEKIRRQDVIFDCTMTVRIATYSLASEKYPTQSTLKRYVTNIAQLQYHPRQTDAVTATRKHQLNGTPSLPPTTNRSFSCSLRMYVRLLDSRSANNGKHLVQLNVKLFAQGARTHPCVFMRDRLVRCCTSRRRNFRTGLRRDLRAPVWKW